MFPMIRNQKDQVHIVPVKEPLKRYDVAVYSRPGRFVVHRVLGLEGDHYIIRGDNCIAKEYVPLENVVGVVDGFWRRGHYISVTNIWYRMYSRIWVFIHPLIPVKLFFQKVIRYLKKHFFRAGPHHRDLH